MQQPHRQQMDCYLTTNATRRLFVCFERLRGCDRCRVAGSVASHRIGMTNCTAV
jgi:hypothetical protein